MTEEEQIRAEIEAEMRIQAAEEAKIRLQIEEEMRIEAKRQAEERLRQEVPNLIKAADEGDMESQAKVGENYDGGKCYFPSDISKAFHYTKLAAEQGHAEAQNKLAHWYCEGYGFTMDKDPQKAFEWFKKSAEQGHPNSMAYLGGWCYLDGNGVEQDYCLAKKWLKRALEIKPDDEWAKKIYDHTKAVSIPLHSSPRTAILPVSSSHLKSNIPDISEILNGTCMHPTSTQSIFGEAIYLCPTWAS